MTPTLFFYGGVHDTNYLDLVIHVGAKRAVLNYALLTRHSKAKLEHILIKSQSNGVELMLDPGISGLVTSLLNDYPNHLPYEGLKMIGDFIGAYYEFIKKYKQYFAHILNPCADNLFYRVVAHTHESVPVEKPDGTTDRSGGELLAEWDKQFIAIFAEDESRPKLYKYWSPAHKYESLQNMEAFDGVALIGLKNKNMVRLMVSDARDKLVHVVGMARTEWLNTMGLSSATISGWFGGQKYGITYIWDGKNLTEYNSKRQLECRQRHAAHFKSLGLDPQKILDDDPLEVNKANLRAWFDFERSIHQREVGGYLRPDSPKAGPPSGDWKDTYTFEESVTEVVKQYDGALRDLSDTPEVEVVDAPHVDTFKPAEPIKPEEMPKPTNRKQELMKGNTNAVTHGKNSKQANIIEGFSLGCNNCAIRHKCPKFEEDALCAYRKEFGMLSTRNTEQALTELENLATIQQQRVVRGALFEIHALGGGLDKQTGQEIERQQKLLESIAKIRRDVAQTQTQNQTNGILASLFGAFMAQPQELKDEDFIEVDAKVVDKDEND